MRIGRSVTSLTASLVVPVVLLAMPRAAALDIPANVTVTRDVRYADDGGVAQLLDVYAPTHRGAPVPAIVVVHGGGFYEGSKGDPDVTKLSAVLAALGYVVFNIDYRLAPQYPYPAANEDVQHAIEFARDNASRFGVDPARIAIVGSSAGSTLAAWAGFVGSGPTDVASRVAAVVTWSGAFDLAALPSQVPAGDARVNPTLPGHGYFVPGPDLPADVKAASPVTYVDGSDPPIMMFNSAHEQAPLAQPQAMLSAAQQHGVRASLIVRPGSAHALNGPNLAPYIARSVLFLDHELHHHGFAALFQRANLRFAHRKIDLVLLLLLIVAAAAAFGRREPQPARRAR